MPKLKVSGNKEVRELVRWAEGLGYEAERTSGGHIRFVHKSVSEPIFCPSTPSDHRSLRNTEAMLIGRLSEVANETLKKDPLRGEKYDSDASAFSCPACQGRGVQRVFAHPQGLIAHMAKDHPAPSLEPEPELEAAPSERAEKEEPVPNEETENSRPNPVRVGELEALLEKLHRDGEIDEDGFVTLEMLRERFPGRFVDTAVMAMKKRQDGDWIRLRNGDKKGQYRVVRGKSEKWSWSSSSPEEDGVFPPPVFSETKIFEEVNRFVDGKLLLRDAEGHLYQAEIERLS